MENTEYAQWYVMRDLKRCNAKKPAYKQLQEAGVKVFVPLKWQIILQKDKKVREKVPVIQDLLFVYDSRRHLDSIVERTKTLQYRWLRNTLIWKWTDSYKPSAVPIHPNIICRKR